MDHFAPNGFRGLRFEGDAGVVIANWRDDTQAGYDTLPDVEPISCTRCDDLTFRNLEIYAGGNQDLNNSSDTFDFDGCSNVLVEHCKVRRSRARALVMDGGDDGAVSSRSRVAFCEFAGIAPPPKATIGPAGALVVQTYRYVVTYVDSLYGETPCGDPTV